MLFSLLQKVSAPDIRCSTWLLPILLICLISSFPLFLSAAGTAPRVVDCTLAYGGMWRKAVFAKKTQVGLEGFCLLCLSPIEAFSDVASVVSSRQRRLFNCEMLGD